MANQQLQALSEARGTTELHHEPALFGVSAAGWVALAMLAVFAIMLWAKVPAMLAKMLDARIDAIRRQLDEAKAMRAEAEQLLGAAEARLKASAGDAEAIVAQAEQEAQALRARAEADAAELIARRRKLAEDKIAAAERSALAEVRGAAAEAATRAAAAIIARDHGARADKPLVDQAIAGLGRVN